MSVTFSVNGQTAFLQQFSSIMQLDTVVHTVPHSILIYLIKAGELSAMISPLLPTLQGLGPPQDPL